MHLDKVLIFFTFAIIYPAGVIESYRILGILPTTFKSHFIFGSALMKGLAQKGHEVYVISPFPQKSSIKNYHDVPFVYEGTEDDFYMESEESAYKLSINAQETRMAFSIFSSSHVQQLMESNVTFDVVICEVFYSESLFGFSEHYKAPLIALSTFGYTPWNTYMIGSPSPPSYVPSLSTEYTDRMSFVERVLNFKTIAFEGHALESGLLPRQVDYYKEYFPHVENDMYTVRKNAAAVLLNTHVSLSYPRPYVPNQIAVGGLHINRTRNPLPADIEKFIKDAEHGVVYFSMGTHTGSKKFLSSVAQRMLSAFSTLNQRVLWKLEDVALNGRRKNVLIRDWFPQNDILAHDNVKVFITQGGILSMTESIYHGKPIIGIPILGDQFANVAKAQAEGMGISLDHTVMAEQIIEAVKDVISNKSYSERAQEMSARYRDQPMLPLDLAVYWVERVARQKGAKYLHCAGLDLTFIQYHNIDVYGGIITVLLLIIYIFYVLFNTIWRKLVLRKYRKEIAKMKKKEKKKEKREMERKEMEEKEMMEQKQKEMRMLKKMKDKQEKKEQKEKEMEEKKEENEKNEKNEENEKNETNEKNEKNEKKENGIENYNEMDEMNENEDVKEKKTEKKNKAKKEGKRKGKQNKK